MLTNFFIHLSRRVLNLPQGTVTEYKAHNDSLKDNSSFRNTDVRWTVRANKFLQELTTYTLNMFYSFPKLRNDTFL